MSESPFGSEDLPSLIQFVARAKTELFDLVGPRDTGQSEHQKIHDAANKMRGLGLDPAECIVYIEVAKDDAEEKSSREGEEFSTDYALLIAFLLGVQRGRMNKAEEAEVVDAGT